MLSERQQRLYQFMCKLSSINYSKYTNVISNTSTYIVNLECGGGYFASNIDARLIKSPLSSFNSRPLKIVESGFVDVVPNYLSENGEGVAGGLDE
jgi:hypothetical protein